MDPASLEFARPAWLFAGVALCVLAAGLWVWFDRRREADLSRLVHARFRARLLPGISRGLQWTKRGLWLGGALLLCTAAAGPRLGYEWRDVRQRGIDLLFAVDTSRSMLAEDLSPNRLERARMGIQDFVERLHGDRVGLIPFAGSSYAMCPLTTDYDAFSQALRTLSTELIPRQGTDVASAIREAKRLFDEQKHNHRILVLMTDGEDFQDDVDVAIEEARKDGMTIHTIGVGSAEGGQIPFVNPQGQKDFVRDEQERIVVTKLGEGTLRKISEATGGLYAPLGRGAEGLEMIYKEKLRLMPKEERERGMERIPLERFGWPLAAGLLLLLVEFLLPDRRREARAKALPSAARRHATALLLVLLGCGFASQARAEEDPRVLYNEGTAAYEANDFKTAADKLKASLKTTDLDLQNKAYYNLGNALYQQSKKAESAEDAIKLMEEAKKAYADASTLNPTDEDARHNQKVVEKKIKDAKNQKDRKDGQDGKDGDSKDEEKGKEGQDGKNDKNSDGQKGDEKNQKDQKDQKGNEKGANQDKQGDQSQQDQQDGKQQDGEKQGQPGEQKEGQDQKNQSDSGEGKDKKDGKEGASQQAEGDKKEGEGKEGEGKEGEGKEGEGKDGKGKEGEGKEGEGKDGKGKQGEGKEGEGKDGKGKEGEGKEGEGEDGKAKEGEGKEGEGKDGKGKQGEGKEGEGKDGKGKQGEGKEGEGKDGKGKEGEGKEGEGKDGKGKEGEGKEGEGKEGEGKDGKGDQKNAQAAQQFMAGERRKPGDMTAEEARQLLKTMRVQEATVLPFQPLTPQERRYTNPKYSTKGKTW